MLTVTGCFTFHGHLFSSLKIAHLTGRRMKTVTTNRFFSCSILQFWLVSNTNVELNKQCSHDVRAHTSGCFGEKKSWNGSAELIRDREHDLK